jgi:hypothetical protein
MERMGELGKNWLRGVFGRTLEVDPRSAQSRQHYCSGDRRASTPMPTRWLPWSVVTAVSAVQVEQQVVTCRARSLKSQVHGKKGVTCRLLHVNVLVHQSGVDSTHTGDTPPAPRSLHGSQCTRTRHHTQLDQINVHALRLAE